MITRTNIVGFIHRMIYDKHGKLCHDCIGDDMHDMVEEEYGLNCFYIKGQSDGLFRSDLLVSELMEELCEH